MIPWHKIELDISDVTEQLPQLICSVTPESSLIFRKTIREHSEETKGIIETIYAHPPQTFIRNLPALRKALKERGWPAHRIRKGFQEIKDFLYNGGGKNGKKNKESNKARTTPMGRLHARPTRKLRKIRKRRKRISKIRRETMDR